MTEYKALVAALRCDGAYRYDGCKGCLYEGRCLVSNQMQDAADAIEELMAEIERIRQTSVSHEVYQAVCRERDAAVEDMKVMALAMRESDELSEGCCFACVCDGQNLPGNVILPYGECPGYDTNDCFEWRGPVARKGE